MKTLALLRAALTLAMVVPLGLAQRPKPRPAPTPAPAPAPAQDEKQREEDAKKAREKARQEEADKAAQEAERVKRARQEASEAERVKRARQDASEAERVQRAREEANRPERVAAAREEAQRTAEDMLRIEGVHRERLGRLDRLLAVYGESGDQAHLEVVETLKRRENKRYLLIIDQFKTKLGPAFAQYEPKLLAGQQRRGEGSPPGLERAPGRERAPGLEKKGEQPVPPRRAPKPAKEKSEGGGQ